MRGGCSGSTRPKTSTRVPLRSLLLASALAFSALAFPVSAGAADLSVGALPSANRPAASPSASPDGCFFGHCVPWLPFTIGDPPPPPPPPPDTCKSTVVPPAVSSYYAAPGESFTWTGEGTVECNFAHPIALTAWITGYLSGVEYRSVNQSGPNSRCSSSTYCTTEATFSWNPPWPCRAGDTENYDLQTELQWTWWDSHGDQYSEPYDYSAHDIGKFVCNPGTGLLAPP